MQDAGKRGSVQDASIKHEPKVLTPARQLPISARRHSQLIQPQEKKNQTYLTMASHISNNFADSQANNKGGSLTSTGAAMNRHGVNLSILFWRRRMFVVASRRRFWMTVGYLFGKSTNDG